MSDENFGQAEIDEHDDWRGRYNEALHDHKEDCEILQDLLLQIDVSVELETILKWSEAEYVEVESWACKHILRANDNNVRVPKTPTVIENYQR